MNNKPSQIARDLNLLTAELGSVSLAAKKAGISQAQAYRYLKLNKLPAIEQEKVDAGLRPIEIKRTIRKSRPLQDTVQVQLFDNLTRIKFATINQLTTYANCNIKKSRQMLENLIRLKMIKKNTEYSPYVYSLTSKGHALSNQGKPKHFISGAAIHQALLRNNIEIEIKKRNPESRFISRAGWWQRGIYPAIGEHGLKYKNKDKFEYAFILLDDYMMNPDRTLHSLLRKHDKNKSYVAGNLSYRWADIASTYLIYTTSQAQKERHLKFYNKHKSEFSIIPNFRIIEPIWDIF